MNAEHPTNTNYRVELIAGLIFLACLAGCAPTGDGSGGMSDPLLSSASKDAPFTNTLGMKFVPIPGTKILMCTTETTVEQYQAAGRGYNKPWFSQGSHHPAVNITWDDAKAWCDWISAKEGRKYRLPTSQEWSAAAGAGPYPWGASWPPPSGSGNYCGQEWRKASSQDVAELAEIWTAKYGAKKDLMGGYEDSYLYTAPVESQSPNSLGLRHLSGNVWEWCESKVLRGGSWADNSKDFVNLNASVGSSLYDFDNGFRCVLEN